MWKGSHQTSGDIPRIYVMSQHDRTPHNLPTTEKIPISLPGVNLQIPIITLYHPESCTLTHGDSVRKTLVRSPLKSFSIKASYEA